MTSLTDGIDVLFKRKITSITKINGDSKEKNEFFMKKYLFRFGKISKQVSK